MTAYSPRLLVVLFSILAVSSRGADQPADAGALQAEARKRVRIDKLIARLPGAEGEVREGIEKELADIGKDVMVPLKLAALSDDFELRKAATASAGRVRWRIACDPRLLADHGRLIETMAGTDAAARAEMVDKIAQDPKASTVTFFGECLADDQAFVRQRAIDGLLAAVENGVPRQQAAPYLEAAIADPDRNIRVLAIGALAQVGGASLTKLASLLNDESMEVRVTIIQAIGRSREPAAAEHLKPLLRDPQWRIRAAALDAMAQLRMEKNAGRVADAVVECLADEDTFVRGKAAKLLADWKFAGAGATLRKMLADKRIDEDTAFASLATLKDAEAVPLMLRAYEKVDPLRRAQLLRWLSFYDRETRTAGLFDAALKDETMKAAWPQIIDMLAWQPDAARFRPRLTELLLTGDPAAAHAAWNVLQRALAEKPLEDSVVNALLQSPDAARARIGLHAAYIAGGEVLEKALPPGLAHADAAVIDLALVLTAHHYLKHTLGGVLPDKPYLRDELNEEMMMNPRPSSGAPKARPQPALADALRDAIAAQLKHEDIVIRTRAAGILYRAEKQAAETVLAVLRASLRDDEPANRRVALIAVASKPAPFLPSLDLEALAADEITAPEAIEIMAASGDAKYLDTIKRFAQNVNPEEPQTLLALIRAGQPEIIKIAAARVKKLEEYERQRFHRNLRAMPGPGAVLFMEQFLDVNPRNRYGIVEVANIVLTLPDPSVKALLHKLSKAKIEDYGDNLSSRITGRLLELDPEATLGQLRDDLIKGDARKQAAALAALLGTSPTTQSLELAWEGARAKVKTVSPVWAGVAAWLPAVEAEGRWIRNMGTLHAPIQGALLRRLAGELKPAHLAVLTTIGTSDPATREYLSSLIAILTANDPVNRPALDKVAEAALPQVLSAAGEWGEAVKAVDPYLMDERGAVADGARRGLALHLIGKPKAIELSDAHRDALIAGAMSKDDVTAFLCAEALGLHAPMALAGLEIDKLNSDYPKLRLALLEGNDASPALREVVKKHIASGGGVSSALAIRSAQKGDVEPGTFRWRRGFGPGMMGPDADMIERLTALAATTGDVALARDLADNVSLPRGTASGNAAIDMLLSEARKGDPRLFARMASYIEDPAPDDLGRLIAAIGSFDAAQHDFLLNLALQWAPAAPSGEIAKLIGTSNEAAIVASAIAAIRWGDEKARQSLITAATRKKAVLFGAAMGKRRNLALVALRIAGKAEDVPLLLAGYKNIDANDREEQLARMEMQRLILRLAPQDAIKLLPPASDEDRFGHFHERVLIGAKFETSLLMMDDAKWKPAEANEEERYNTTQAMALINLLADQKAAAASATKTPVPAAALPPWNSEQSPNGASKRLLYEDTTELSKKQLHMRIAMLRNLERMEEEAASRPAGSIPSRGTSGFPSRTFPLPGGRYSTGLVDDDEEMDDDDLRLRMMQRDFGTEGSDSEAEDYYSIHMNTNRWAGVAHLGESAVAEALKPLFESKWPGTRIAAMRAAAAWWTPSLGDALMKRLREGVTEAERVEAAWALAVLRGPEAAKAIDEARAKRHGFTEFSERLRLACLLRALGSEAGRAEIDRAIELRAMRSLRARFIEPRGAAAAANGYRPRSAGEAFGDSDDLMGRDNDDYIGADPLRSKLEPWSPALRLGAADLMRDDDARKSVKPNDASEYAPRRPQIGKRITPPNIVMLASGKMAAVGASPDAPPISSLVVENLAAAHMLLGDDGTSSPRFMLMMEAEQMLEPYYFVQFADTAADTMDLRNKWESWWNDNRGKPREQWMRQALTQATAELTHANWWHRLRAARRIMRLTGAKIAPPNPFDLPAWKALQSQWAARATDGVTTILLNHAMEAKVIATVPDAADRAALLKALVHIGGHAPAHLSEAALLHLHAWPDDDAMLRAALAWQHSPRRELLEWTQDRMRERGGQRRAVYVEGDLGK
jgi:HEAT repeat protein